MKKNILFYVLVLICCLAACNVHEDDLEPSGRNKNWMVIEDKPGEFNQLVYQVYRESGMAIFVNDTLGTETRGLDAYGNPIIHHEMYIVGYSISAVKSDAGIVLSSDTAAMTEAVRVINEKVIPRFPENINYRPGCMLLVDTLYTSEYDWSPILGKGLSVRDGYAYRDMMGIVVGGLADILQKTEDEKAYWAGMILANNIELQIESIYAEELVDFYAVTDTAKVSFYKKGSYKDPVSGAVYSPFFHNIDCEQLGFLEWQLDGDYILMSGNVEHPRLRIMSPTKQIDVANYIAAVYAYDEATFRQKYAAYPKCLKKYAIMKALVEDFETNYAKKRE